MVAGRSHISSILNSADLYISVDQFDKEVHQALIAIDIPGLVWQETHENACA